MLGTFHGFYFPYSPYFTSKIQHALILKLCSPLFPGKDFLGDTPLPLAAFRGDFLGVVLPCFLDDLREDLYEE